MTVAITIKTLDRTPRRNFLGATLANLARAGVLGSPHLESLTLVDSGSPDFEAYWAAEVVPNVPPEHLGKIARDLPHEGGRRTLHQNAARAIELASRSEAEWALVIEDDIDVVDGFLDTVLAWLADHEQPGQMYAFGAAYARVGYLAGIGKSYYRYPLADFYGAQALAWRTEDAAQLAGWLGDDPAYKGDRDRSHDLLLQEWGAARGLTHFLASAPPLVQHIGNESSIGNDHFAFDSWPGRAYEYPGRRPSVLWVGDAAVSTGFARCTHAVCDELHRAGWEVNILALNYYGDQHGYPYALWPCVQPLDNGRDAWGVSRLPALIQRLAPDLVVILSDPWQIAPYLDSMEGFQKELERQNIRTVPPPVVAWLAVDAKNQKGEPLNRLTEVVTWTRFAAEELKAGGYDGDPQIVPLGVDTARFYPRSRSDARKVVLPPSVPEGAFVVGAVGRNQPRKRLDLTIEYFAEWVRLHHVEDAYLLLHVAPTGEAGCDIPALVRYHGISGRVVLSEPHVGLGMPDVAMPMVYSAMDVYVTMTTGEGWCLPALEAMACGVPCAVPNWSALGEWARDAAALVGCSGTALNSPINGRPYTIGGVPDKREFIQVLDGLYRSEIQRKAYRQRGLALAKQFSWERTGREMRKALEVVARGHATARVGQPESEEATA